MSGKFGPSWSVAGPDAYQLAERHAAYHRLQAAATMNKDHARAAEDRVLESR